MKSSGTTRGLAVSAVGALALAGLAFAPAQAQTIGGGTPAGTVRLYTGDQSGAYTNQFDGRNSSVQLLAGVSDNIAGANSVRFSYLKGGVQVNITTVPIFNGLATADWVAPAGAEGAAITDLRAQVLGVTNNVLATYDAGGVAGTATPNVGSQPVSIDADNRDEVGLSLDGEIVVTGKTKEATASVGDTFANTQLQNEGPVADNNVNFFPISTDVADVNTLTPYAALVTVNPTNLTAQPVDEVVVTTRIFAEGDDVRVLSVYDQTPTTTSKATAPGFPANVAGGAANEQTHWVISVKDQKGNPLSGLDIFESDETGANFGPAAGMGRNLDNTPFDNDETGYDGNLSIRLNEAGPFGIDSGVDQDPAPGVGATYVVVDYDQDGVYDNGLDQLLKLSNTNLPQAPATVTVTSSLGNVMDADESTVVTFKVTDANGDPVNGAALTGSIARDVADNSPADATMALAIGNTDVNGESDVTLQPGIDGNAVAATISASSGTAAGTLAIETDEAVTTWDEYPTHQVLATTDTVEGGVVELPSGSVLPGRTIGLTLTNNDNSLFSPQAEQPAGTLRGSATTASATTDAAGRYSVKIDDPALPNGQELDNEVVGSALDLTTGFAINGALDCPALVPGLPNCVTLDLDWLRTVTPTRIEILNAIGGTTADGLAPGLGGALRPGGAGVGEVVAYNADNIALEDIDVNLTIDEGNFVDFTEPFENIAVGAPVDFKSVGKTITVNTGDVIVGQGNIIDIKGAFLANIERNTGFDDDGDVRDAITATAGAIKDEHDLTWTTNGVPINPRATNPLVVELSADQESSILPKARAGNGFSAQTVDYDVNTYDQFENPTSQNIDSTDNTPLASIVNGFQSDFALNQPAMSAEATATTNQSIEVELEGASTLTYTDNPANSVFDPANPAAILGTTPVVEEVNTDTINWYEAIVTSDSFVLTQQGPEEVPVGSTVSYTLTGTDQEGQPLNGFGAGFLRVGPGNDTSDDGQLTDVTNANGRAFYDFAGGTAGKANVSAVVYSDDLGRSRLFVTPTDTVTFAAGSTTRANINPKLLGESGRKFDQLTVRAERAPGALVRFYKKTKNGREILKSKKLDGNGSVSVRIKDANGNKRTRYFAIVSKTDINTRAKTNVKKVR